MDWLVLQLGDSAFPAGGFAHSAGLEAAHQLGEVTGGSGLVAFVDASLWQAGVGALPFVAAAHDAPEALVAHDAASDAFLTSHVANRASRTQGRAFIATCARVWSEPRIAALHEAVRRRELFAHHAPIFGAALAVLGVPRRETLGLYLHLTLRGIASAAVRLGIVGPHEAQSLQHARAATLAAVLDACGCLSDGPSDGPGDARALDDVAQTAPLIDLFGSTQDRLYSRLFQS